MSDVIQVREGIVAEAVAISLAVPELENPPLASEYATKPLKFFV